ncbi:hypothetical protein D3C72_2288200 [compost metagenome]
MPSSESRSMTAGKATDFLAWLTIANACPREFSPGPTFHGNGLRSLNAAPFGGEITPLARFSAPILRATSEIAVSRAHRTFSCLPMGRGVTQARLFALDLP